MKAVFQPTTQLHKRCSCRAAFTIVELLIVIVVIAILAAVTIVAFNGAQNRALQSTLQADTDKARKKIMLYHAENGTYPTAINCTSQSSTEICVQASGTNRYTYSVNNSTNPQSFRVNAVNGSYIYTATESNPVDQTPPVVATGLVVYLDTGNQASYSGAGSTTWYDLSGKGNNAILAGGVAFSSDQGGSLAFDGTDDSAIITNLNSNITTAFTVSVWMKFDKYAYMQPLAMNGMSAFKWRVSGQYPYWNIYNSVGNFDNSIAYSVIPNINEWHYYAFTYDGATEKIYFDSVLNKQFARAITLSAPTRLDVAPSVVEPLDGSISSVTIYNRALTDAEITQNFNALRGRYGL